MELSSQEAGDIPIPLNSAFGHMIHHESAPHNHIIPPSTAPPPQIPSTGPTNHHLDHHDHHHVAPYNNNNNNNNVKKVVKYRECLKNHAAAMGGNATDGCGEFMPSGEEGTIEALNCSACNCHRNFHRKEIEGDHQPHPYDHFYGAHLHSPHLSRVGARKVVLGHHHHHQYHNHHHKSAVIPPEALGYPTATTGTLRAAAPQQMIMSAYNMGSQLPSESDEQGGGEDTFGAVVVPRGQVMKKRFRTKFSTEQKEKMLNFAEKVGWKIQKQEEGVVQQFCQEIGVKRRVLKVWMHNNKHNLAKKNPSNSTLNNNNNTINNVTAAAAAATTTPAA